MIKQKMPVTLDDLEESAKQEADGTKNYRLKGNKWLEIMYRHKIFYYYYGVTEISKIEAEKILRECQ